MLRNVPDKVGQGASADVRVHDLRGFLRQRHTSGLVLSGARHSYLHSSARQ